MRLTDATGIEKREGRISFAVIFLRGTVGMPEEANFCAARGGKGAEPVIRIFCLIDMSVRENDGNAL